MKRSEEIHIVCSLRTTPQHRKDFSELLAALVEPARAEEGCLYYDVYQDRNDPDAFFHFGWLEKPRSGGRAYQTSECAKTESPNSCLAGKRERFDVWSTDSGGAIN